MGSILGQYHLVAAYFVAVTVIAYWLVYGALRTTENYRIRFGFQILGMGLGVLASPLVANILFADLHEIMIADVDWRYYVTGLCAAIVGQVTARHFQNRKDNSPPSHTFTSQDEWDFLTAHDVNVRKALEIVTPYGADAIEELRRAYGTIKDRTRMPKVANDIVQRRRLIPAHRRAAQRDTEKVLAQLHDLSADELRVKMAEVGITRNLNGQYQLGTEMFETLEQAFVSAANKKTKEPL